MACFVFSKVLDKLVQFRKIIVFDFFYFAYDINCGSFCIHWSTCSIKRIEYLPDSVRQLIVIGCSVRFRVVTYNVLFCPPVISEKVNDISVSFSRVSFG